MLSVREAVDEYLEAIVLRRSHGWVRHQRTYLLKEIVPRWGDRALDTITSDMVEEYVRVCARSRKNTTVNKRLSSVRRLFAWALKKRVLTSNPAERVERLPDDTLIRCEILTRYELDRLTAMSGPKLRMFVTLAYHTGIRAGEAKRLRWQDVDLLRRLLRIAGEKAGVGQRERIRWIPINSELLTALESYRQIPEGRCRHLFEYGGTHNWSNLNRKFKTAVEDAGFEAERHITPHTLRHTFGAEMAMRGVPLRKIQLLMGHSSVVTTETWYAHYSPDYLMGATEVLVGHGIT